MCFSVRVRKICLTSIAFLANSELVSVGYKYKCLSLDRLLSKPLWSQCVWKEEEVRKLCASLWARVLDTKGYFFLLWWKRFRHTLQTIITVISFYNLILFYLGFVDRCLLWFFKYLVLMVKSTSEEKTQKYAYRSTEWYQTNWEILVFDNICAAELLVRTNNSVWWNWSWKHLF